MTVDQLIAEVLAAIRNHWYADRVREFKRDERALMKAVLRYGHTCHQRGWEFGADFIFAQLMTLLKQIRTNGADIKYLPVYLDGAVTRSLGLRAEELSAQAKNIRTQTLKATMGIKVVEYQKEKTDAEICSAVFKALQRGRKKRPVKALKQEALL